LPAQALPHDAAARSAGTLTTGKQPQEPGSHAARGRQIFVLTDVDDPCSSADRHSRKARRVARIEPTLRVGSAAHGLHCNANGGSRQDDARTRSKPQRHVSPFFRLPARTVAGAALRNILAHGITILA